MPLKTLLIFVLLAPVLAGFRLWKNLYGVAEYRVNDFRLGNENNLAVGIEYKHAWR